MNLTRKILIFCLSFKISFLSLINYTYANESFESWLVSYKNFALEKGVSQETVNIAFKNVKFLEQVIKYDRKQPEFFEDTITYVNKRANDLRSNKAKKLLKKNNKLFIEVEKKLYEAALQTQALHDPKNEIIKN